MQVATGRGSSGQDVTAVRAGWLFRSCSEPLGSGLLKCAPGQPCFPERLLSTWSLLDTLINCGVACFVYHLFYMRSGEHQRKSHRGICKAKGGCASPGVKLNCVSFALPLGAVGAKSLHWFNNWVDNYVKQTFLKGCFTQTPQIPDHWRSWRLGIDSGAMSLYASKNCLCQENLFFQ